MSIHKRKIGLGKGLSALLNDTDEVLNRTDKAGASPAQNHTAPGAHTPGAGSTNDPMPADRSAANPGGISEIEVDRIAINPFQPRTDFDEEALKELSESIKLQGLIQPITVRQDTLGHYQLISGERRLRASKMAGLKTIPAYIRTANDQQMLEMALIENIQRENLNAIEVALSFQRMIEELDLKQEELGERVSKNRSTVTNYLRLLKLPPAIQVAIRDGQLSMGHARALINVSDIEKQLYIFHEIVKNGLSVRKTEELVRAVQEGAQLRKKSASDKKALPFQLQRIEDDLASRFATRVRLKQTGKKGQGAIEIPFHSDEDLNRILELLDW